MSDVIDSTIGAILFWFRRAGTVRYASQQELTSVSYNRLALIPRYLACSVLAIVLLSGCQSGKEVAQSTGHFKKQKTGFVERKVTVDGVTHSVWVFVPSDYNYKPKQLYPAILFLHGLFEMGNGNVNVLAGGLGPVIARNPDHWPFLTIFPQSTGSWKGADREKLAMAALRDAQKEYAIDPDRVILAGLSFGGLGVWEIGAHNSEKFAALVPVSGPAAPALCDDLRGVPIWAFASTEDPIVPAQGSVDTASTDSATRIEIIGSAAPAVPV